MDDEDDFILVKGKLPRTNKDGSPSVGHLGTGGLRRDDGTVERLVQDLQPLDEQEPDTIQTPWSGPAEPPPERFGEAMARAAVEGIAEGIGNSIRNATGKEPAEAFVDFVDERIRRWWRERKERRKVQAQSGHEPAPVVEVDESTDTESALPVAEEPRLSLTREEAERLYREMVQSAVVSEALRRVLSNAQLRDQGDEQALGEIASPELAELAARALDSNPDLITEILKGAFTDKSLFESERDSAGRLMNEEPQRLEPRTP